MATAKHRPQLDMFWKLKVCYFSILHVTYTIHKKIVFKISPWYNLNETFCIYDYVSWMTMFVHEYRVLLSGTVLFFFFFNFFKICGNNNNYIINKMNLQYIVTNCHIDRKQNCTCSKLKCRWIRLYLYLSRPSYPVQAYFEEHF